MPSLPPLEEEPTRVERATEVVRTLGASIGGDHLIRARVIVFVGISAIALTFAPVPWAQIGLLGLLGIVFDLARTLAKRL